MSIKNMDSFHSTVPAGAECSSLEKGSVSRAAVEAAYCIFHQKLRVYQHSTNSVQRDDIEYAVSSYAMEMNQRLYRLIADGREGFLMEHTRFEADLSDAVARLEGML